MRIKQLFLFNLLLFGTVFASRAVDFEYDGVTYTILSDVDKTVSTKAGTSSINPGHKDLTGELKLHAEVPYNGETYTLTEIGAYSFRNCSELTGALIIPESVKTISQYAFYHCSGFTGSLTIGDGVTSIGNNAFNGCKGFIGSLIIPDCVTSIGEYAFYGCSGFTGSLTIPDAVTSIESNTFRECTGFTSVTIGDGITSIGQFAFYNCNKITALEIGRSVEKIGGSSGQTFNYCSKIESVTCHAETPPVFYGNNNFDSTVLQNAYLYVPAESSGLYAVADVWKDFVNRDEVSTPVETVTKALFMSLDSTLDLNTVLPDVPADCIVVSQYPAVADVTAGNMVEAKQFGQTNITYSHKGITYASIDIYVCPTLTLEHGEGAVSTHFVLHNTCPTVYLEPANGYDINGVTHDGVDVTEAVTEANGYYTFAEPITDNTVINMAMHYNGLSSVSGVVTDAEGMRVLVYGHSVTVMGMVAGDTVTVYDMGGEVVMTTESSSFDVVPSGVFLVTVGEKTFKILVR